MSILRATIIMCVTILISLLTLTLYGSFHDRYQLSVNNNGLYIFDRKTTATDFCDTYHCVGVGSKFMEAKQVNIAQIPGVPFLTQMQQPEFAQYPMGIPGVPVPTAGIPPHMNPYMMQGMMPGMAPGMMPPYMNPYMMPPEMMPHQMIAPGVQNEEGQPKQAGATPMMQPPQLHPIQMGQAGDQQGAQEMQQAAPTPPAPEAAGAQAAGGPEAGAPGQQGPVADQASAEQDMQGQQPGADQQQMMGQNDQGQQQFDSGNQMNQMAPSTPPQGMMGQPPMPPQQVAQQAPVLQAMPAAAVVPETHPMNVDNMLTLSSGDDMAEVVPVMAKKSSAADDEDEF